jgi:hypothetical protein
MIIWKTKEGILKRGLTFSEKGNLIGNKEGVKNEWERNTHKNYKVSRLDWREKKQKSKILHTEEEV